MQTLAELQACECPDRIADHDASVIKNFFKFYGRLSAAGFFGALYPVYLRGEALLA